MYEKGIKQTQNMSMETTQHFLFDKILVRNDVVLPNPEWWEEMFEFCPTFFTWKLWFSRTKVSHVFQLEIFCWNKQFIQKYKNWFAKAEN